MPSNITQETLAKALQKLKEIEYPPPTLFYCSDEFIEEVLKPLASKNQVQK